MKKKSSGKKILCLLLAAGCIASLAGCGGKEKASETGKAVQPREFVYVPEYQDINVKGNMGNTVISNDTIYFVEGYFNEETEVYEQKFKSLKVGETESFEIPITLEENNNVSGMFVEKDGNILVCISKYEQNGEDYKESSFLKRFTADGTEKMSVEITDLGKDLEYFYVSNMTEDAEGNIYLSGGEKNVWVMDKDGKQLAALESTDWINSMTVLPNGKVAIAYWGQDGGMIFSEIDLETKQFGKQYKNVPQVNGSFAVGGENKLIASSGNVVYSYDISTETSEEILNWIDCDMNGDNVRNIAMLEDGRIFAISETYEEPDSEGPVTWKTEFVYLTKKNASEVVQKEIITLGVLYMDQSVKENIINFNKTNEKYRIQVTEYASQDWETGRTQFNNDIVSGNGPDIIDLSNGNADLYIAKGIMEDLTPYIDKDLKREDYVQKALEAYAQGDKLYGIAPSFSVNTVLGKTSDVGKEPGWTIDDVMALLDSKPEGTELFEYSSRDSILSYMVMMSLDSFVDWEKGECNFTDGYFEKVLEFANRFPKEVNYEEDGESTPTKIQNGSLLLEQINITDMEYYQMFSLMFGEETTFIGYPSNGGSGSYIVPNSGLGINAKSEKKDGAWEFIKSFLSDEYQTEKLRWALPVKNSALDAYFEKAMKKEYTEDENGKKIEIPKTTWGYDDWEAEIFAATQEQVDAVKNLIEIADGTMSNNEEIANIIMEEAAAYFEGQKSAKEVADIVQSRVKIYVNENR